MNGSGFGMSGIRIPTVQGAVKEDGRVFIKKIFTIVSNLNNINNFIT
jgi:hypothetical protein